MPRRAGSGDAREQETTLAPAAGPHCLCEHGPQRGCCASARRRSGGGVASWDVLFKLENGHTPSVDLIIIVFGCGKLRRNRVCQAACVANSCLPHRRAWHYNTVVRTMHLHVSHTLPLIFLLLSHSSVALSYPPGTKARPPSSDGI